LKEFGKNCLSAKYIFSENKTATATIVSHLREVNFYRLFFNNYYEF